MLCGPIPPLEGGYWIFHLGNPSTGCWLARVLDVKGEAILDVVEEVGAIS